MKNLHNIRSIFIDLDGTLLSSKRKISDNDVSTLKFLGEQEVYRVIATGRSLFSSLEVLKEGVEIDYLIFANGAGVMHFPSRKLLYNKCLTRNETVAIAEKLSDLKIDFQVRDKIPNSHKYFYRRYFRSNPDFDRLNRKYANCVRQLKNISDLSESTRIITIAPGPEIFEQLKNEFKEFGIIRATSPIDHKSVWTEIYPKDIHKGTGAEFLLKELNINFSSSAGLGNDYNDIDFLKKVAKPFVVKDSPGIMKEDYEVTVSNNQSPLSEIVKLLFKVPEV